jgi:hypothetical protein
MITATRLASVAALLLKGSGQSALRSRRKDPSHSPIPFVVPKGTFATNRNQVSRCAGSSETTAAFLRKEAAVLVVLNLYEHLCCVGAVEPTWI